MPTVGGFLHSTLASLSTGLIISVIRWAIVDTIHHHTCIVKPDFNFSKLHNRLDAYEAAIENHYRFYQYYGNMFIAIFIAYLCHQLSLETWPWHSKSQLIQLLVFIFIESLLFLGSRDALKKTYKRTIQILA